MKPAARGDLEGSPLFVARCRGRTGRDDGEFAAHAAALMNPSERHASRFRTNVIDDDLAFLRSRAIANPDGPEALALAWLQARAIASPRGRVLELIALYKKHGFSIPEVDAYIDEQLVSARERLEQAQRSGALTPRVFGLVSRTVEAAMAAERRRPNCGSSNDKPVLVQALEMVAALAEGRSDSIL